jgi:hypothetical protein
LQRAQYAIFVHGLQLRSHGFIPRQPAYHDHFHKSRTSALVALGDTQPLIALAESGYQPCGKQEGKGYIDYRPLVIMYPVPLYVHFKPSAMMVA